MQQILHFSFLAGDWGDKHVPFEISYIRIGELMYCHLSNLDLEFCSLRVVLGSRYLKAAKEYLS